MAQPTPYERQFAFSGQPKATWAEGLENELNAVKVTSDETLDNLELIQRDDGKLRNGIVTRDSLAPDLALAGLVALDFADEATSVAGEADNIAIAPLGVKQQIDARLADETTPDTDAEKLSTPEDVVRRVVANAKDGLRLAPGSGAVPQTISNKLEDFKFVEDYGAVGDAKRVQTGSISSASATLTATGAGFTAADIGKTIEVRGAGAAGDPLLTTISAYTSSTVVTLANAAGTTVTGAYVTWGTDNQAAFQACHDANNLIFCRNLNYLISGSVGMNRGAGFRSFSKSNTDTTSVRGAPKLFFVGNSSSACITNADPLTFISHAVVRDLNIIASGKFNYIMDFKSSVSMTVADVNMETISLTTNGFRSSKISSGDSSWVNRVENVSIRLPDASTARPFDEDWSDSVVLASYFTGGIGSISQGFNCRYFGTQFERSSDIGMVVLKKTGSRGGGFFGCAFDANKNYGLSFDTTGDAASGRYFSIVVDGCKFRTVNPANTTVIGTADIRYVNPTGNVYYGTQIDNAACTDTITTFIEVNRAQWQGIQVGQVVRINPSQVGTPLDPNGFPYPAARIIGASSAAVSLTGSTSQTTLAAIPVAAGVLGLNGGIRITVLFSYTGSTNTKTMRVTFGGTSFMAVPQTTASNISTRGQIEIHNQNSQSVQVGAPSNYSGLGSSTQAVVTGAIDTSVAQDILITGQLADSGETLTLQSYLVELLPASA